LLAVLLLALAGCETLGGRGETATATTAASETEPETEEAAEEETEPTEEETEAVDAEGAEAAAEALLAALQSGEPDAIRDELDYTNLLLLDEGSPEDSLLAILKKLDYEILDVAAEQSSATVTVSLSSVSIESFFVQYLQRSMELEYNNAILDEPASREQLEEQTQQLFYDMLDENEANRIETTVTLQLSNTGGEWHARVSEALRNAATGGYFSARESASQGMGMGM
jgi:hypothetical protein